MKPRFLSLEQARARDSRRTWSAERPAPAVPSPCVGVCRMQSVPPHPEPLCAGCLRTLAEIAGWSAASDAHKLATWAELERRHRARLPSP